jgi:hypothetical protein
MILDVTELEGPGEVLYTTFYLRVSLEENYAILLSSEQERDCRV